MGLPAPGTQRRPSAKPSGANRRQMGQGLTAEKMKECVWVRPELVARIQFLEGTGADHLRHTKFIALRCRFRNYLAYSFGAIWRQN
jgi:ATP-dependent DNA ligase